MTLASFPNGCLFIASIFAIMGLVLDSIVLQFGNAYNMKHDETMEFFVIWKSSTIRIVTIITPQDRTSNLTFISDGDTIAQETFIANYDYDGVDDIFCSQNQINIIPSSSSSSITTTTADDGDSSCSAFSVIAKWLKISRIMYIITISSVCSTMAMWLFLKCPLNVIHLWRRRNIKSLLLILKCLCFLSWSLSVMTLLVLLIGSLQIHTSELVAEAMILDFEQKNISFGPTVWMLVVNMAVTAVTIYCAFYSRTPSFVFVEWAKKRNESSIDSDSS